LASRRWTGGRISDGLNQGRDDTKSRQRSGPIEAGSRLSRSEMSVNGIGPCLRARTHGGNN